jgi:hypothetical protein
VVIVLSVLWFRASDYPLVSYITLFSKPMLQRLQSEREFKLIQSKYICTLNTNNTNTNRGVMGLTLSHSVTFVTLA